MHKMNPQKMMCGHNSDRKNVYSLLSHASKVKDDTLTIFHDISCL